MKFMTVLTLALLVGVAVSGAIGPITWWMWIIWAMVALFVWYFVRKISAQDNKVLK